MNVSVRGVKKLCSIFRERLFDNINYYFMILVAIPLLVEKSDNIVPTIAPMNIVC